MAAAFEVAMIDWVAARALARSAARTAAPAPATPAEPTPAPPSEPTTPQAPSSGLRCEVVGTPTFPCDRCNGEGSISRGELGDGEREDLVCPKCDGKGRIGG
jgi:anti-sigma factor RsiW